MSSSIRRNSQQPFIDPCENGLKVANGAAKNGERKANIPNVMTSPAMLPSEQVKNGYIKNNHSSPVIYEEEEDSFSSLTDASRPPDGGWGWAVVFASFMIHVIADGITYTLGIYLVELKNAFDEGSGSVSFIPSILVGITLGSGPIASMLVNRFGCRLVTIFGAILAALGLGVSAAATRLVWLYLTIGILTGLGFGLIYLPAIVSVSMYFEKKRAFATGIAVCGSGLGTFIMAPITQALIGNFGWKIALLITGAIVLLNVLFGALFKPLPSSPAESGDTEETPHFADAAVDENEALSSAKPSKNHSFCSDHGILPPEIKVNGEPLKPFATQMGAGGDGKYSQVARMALSHPVLPIQPPVAKPKEQYKSHSRIYDRSVSNSSGQHPQVNHNGHCGHQYERTSRRSSGVMLRRDILYSGSLYNIPEYNGGHPHHKRSCCSQKSSVSGRATGSRKSSSNPRRYSRYHIKGLETQDRAKIKEVPSANDIIDGLLEASQNAENGHKDATKDPKDDVKVCGCIPVGAEAAKGLKQMINFSLFKDSIFIMFVISNFFTSIGFNVPYVYTVDRAINMGVEKNDASFLLSVVGIANTLGRIFLGYISDRPWVNRLYLYNTSLAICGLSMGLSNFCYNYTTQAIFCAVFGVTSGAYVGLTSVVLVDLLGLDNLTNAFGLLLLFQGIASVMGPPFIGWLYDNFGNYESGFYFSGAMIFLSGVMLFVIPRMQRKREARNAELEAQLEFEDDESRFPEIVEEEGYDSDDHQMTMQARP